MESDALVARAPTGGRHLSDERVTHAEIRKLRLLSLGGCMTHDICKRAQCLTLHHTDHMWRRPTISLMSKPPKRFPFLAAGLDAALHRYWHDDFRKSHIEELLHIEADVLVFDITRDIFCSLIEVEDQSYVINPMSVKGILWSEGDLDQDKVNKIVGGNNPDLTFMDERYFEIWAAYFDAFISTFSYFDHIILNKIKFTNKIASKDPNRRFGDSSYVEAANEFLDLAYAYIAKNHKNIIVNSVPNKLLVSGVHVAWGGPTHTHFISESISLFSENLRSILLSENHVSGGLFVQTALERAQDYEDLKLEQLILTAERDKLKAQLGESQQARQVLTAERDGLSQQVQAISGERNGLSQQVQAVIVERDARDAQLSEMKQSRDTLAAERNGLSQQVQAITAERNTLNAQLSEMQQSHQALAAARDSLSQQVQAVSVERDALNGQLGEMQQAHHATAAERSGLSLQVQILTAERDALSARLDEQRNQVALNATRQAPSRGRGSLLLRRFLP